MMLPKGSLLFAVVLAVSPILSSSFQSDGVKRTQISELRPSRWNAKSTISDHTGTVRRHSISTLLAAATKASVVSVCTAELCNCQEEGLFTGDDILQNLQSRNLPYPVEEAPCLGACGGGAMVAIDFEDGSAALVSGIEETLMELGLTLEDDTDAGTNSEVPSNVVTTAATAVSTESVSLSPSSPVAGTPVTSSGDSAMLSTVSTISAPSKTKTNIVPGATASSRSNKVPKKKLVNGYQDARERMRAQATDTEPPSNPWWTAATYLAKKAKESIVDKGQSE